MFRIYLLPIISHIHGTLAGEKKGLWVWPSVAEVRSCKRFSDVESVKVKVSLAFGWQQEAPCK